MTTQDILALRTTKTEKIRLLLANGMTRREVADTLQVGYGFVQNVFAATYPERVGTRGGEQKTSEQSGESRESKRSISKLQPTSLQPTVWSRD